ncbi:hypothetical protein EJB05_18096, partial [Eragrostis curvula]
MSAPHRAAISGLATPVAQLGRSVALLALILGGARAARLHNSGAIPPRAYQPTRRQTTQQHQGWKDRDGGAGLSSPYGVSACHVNGVNLVVNGRRIGTKRGLGARRSRGRVRSRVIHTVHMEMTRSIDGFAVWPQNRGGDEDSVLTRVKANRRPVQVKGPDGLGPRRLDGNEVRGTR